MPRPVAQNTIAAIFDALAEENTRREREGLPLIPHAAWRCVFVGFGRAWDEEQKEVA